MIDQSNNHGREENSAIPGIDDCYTTTIQEYVEIIRDLVDQNHVARVKDIAEIRGVTRSSVSTALNTLRDLNLVDHEHYGYVILTTGGRELGEMLRRRHEIIRRFLHNILDLDERLADEEACRLEHTMSPAALVALVKFVCSLAGHPERLPHPQNCCVDGGTDGFCPYLSAEKSN